MATLPIDKALHSIKVAEFMKAWAPKLNLNPDEAWIIGYVHDIGQMEGIKDHGEVGYQMMKDVSPMLAHYIRIHECINPIEDDMEFLLKLADMSVDNMGNFVGINARVKSIRMRDGDATIDILNSCVGFIRDYANEHSYTDIYSFCK